MSEYPSDWKSANLNDICLRINDGTHFSPKSKKGERLYLTAKNIKNGRIDLDSASFISEEEHRAIYARCPVTKGDLLFTKDGSVGSIAISPFEEEVSLLSSIAVLKVNPSTCDTEYVLQWIASNTFQSVIEQRLTGTAVPRLTLEKINKLPIAYPPLPEQKKIAEALSGIDRYIQSEKIRLSKVLTIYNSLISAIDQYGTATDSGEFVVSKSKVPAEWKLIPFGDLLRIEMEGFTLCENENYSPVVVRRRHSGIETRETKKGASILVKQQFKAKQGCFLISKRQAIHGSTGIIPTGLSVNPIISKEYTQLSSKDERALDIDFLNFYSRTMLFHESIRISVYGVDIEKYVFKDLAWLKQMMLVPPLEEQKEIVCFCKSLEKVIAKYASKIEIMQQLKISLSDDLLSGRKRVSI